jgi:hypothetical protein
VRASRAHSRPSSAYFLFVAAGSPALGEEGFAPAGSIFAAGVLAFAAAVPAVAFSPLGVPEPAPPPAAPPPAAPPGPAASNDDTGAANRASAKAKAHVLFSITLPPLCRGLSDKASTPRGGVGGYHLRCFTLIPPLPVMPADPGAFSRPSGSVSLEPHRRPGVAGRWQWDLWPRRTWKTC